jgi:hypothetical protein
MCYGQREKAILFGLLLHFAREKVPEGRMRERRTNPQRRFHDGLKTIVSGFVEYRRNYIKHRALSSDIFLQQELFALYVFKRRMFLEHLLIFFNGSALMFKIIGNGAGQTFVGNVVQAVGFYGQVTTR